MNIPPLHSIHWDDRARQAEADMAARLEDATRTLPPPCPGCGLHPEPPPGADCPGCTARG
jgi:hypothetical protein